MTVLCIEGPSAAGKSTLAVALAEALGGVVIREVNELFERPAVEPEDWCLNRQIERWHQATAASEAGRVAILDGDVFQPLWYGWAYGFQTYQPLESLARFYRREIGQGRIAFPERYLILQCSREALRHRRDGDATRRRRNFEAHLEFVMPQRRYFEALAEIDLSRVVWVPEGSIDATSELALDALRESVETPTRAADTSILEGVLTVLEGAS